MDSMADRVVALASCVLGILELRTRDSEAQVQLLLEIAEQTALCTALCYSNPRDPKQTIVEFKHEDDTFIQAAFDKLSNLVDVINPVPVVPRNLRVKAESGQSVMVTFTIGE